MPPTWTESEFRDALLHVFDYYEIEYQTEVSLTELGDSTGSSRKMDVYIPKTDTAIELKGKKGDLDRGVGQALNYTRVCKESILMLDGEAIDSYRQDVHRTCQIAPAVHFAMVIPNGSHSGSGAGLDVRTDSRPDLFHEMLHNRDWDDDSAIVKPLIPEYLDHEEKRWTQPLGDHSLSAYQQHGEIKKAIIEYVESSNAPVSYDMIATNVAKKINKVEPHTTDISKAFRSLCEEKQIIKLNKDSYVEKMEKVDRGDESDGQ